MSDNHSISRRDFLRISLGGLAALSLGGTLPLFAQTGTKADLVLFGAPVLTVDPKNSVKRAIAIKGNRILSVENDPATLRSLIGRNTKVIKAPGGCITPGMIDVHNHIVAQSTCTVNWVDLIRCNSAAGVRETLAKWIVEHQWSPGKWVRGIGYMMLWDKVAKMVEEGEMTPPLLDRWDIDQVVEVEGQKVDLSKYPIYLVQLSGHYASLNGMGLIQARIMDRSGGFYKGSDDRCLTYPVKSVEAAFSPQAHAFGSFYNTSVKNGVKQVDGMVFHHYAMEEFVARAMRFAGFPPLDESEMTESLKIRCRDFIRLGVTSIYDNNLRSLSMLPYVKNFPNKAAAGERLRLSLYPYICHLTQGAFPAFASGSRKGVTQMAPLFEGDWVRLIGYKLQLDAAAMTGFTWEPNNSFGDMTRGKLNLWEYNDYMEIVKALDRMKAQMSIHVVGDKALDWTLDVYEVAGVGGKNSRHRIEHLPCVPQNSRNGLKNQVQPLYPRARDLSLIFCPQPGFILYYACFFENIFGAGLGKKRQQKVFPRMTHSIPYRSAVENGIKVALSSDNPCVPNPSPLLALWESVHRRTRRFSKGKEVFLESFEFNHPKENGSVYDERVDFNQALRGHTIDAAYCGFEENKKGSLEAGKLADLVVWNKDIRTIGERTPLSRIQKMKPVLTIIDGEIAFQDSSSGIKTERG